MPTSQNPKIGYVVKRYPRYSETFIVNEILAHEATGMEIEIFSLRPPSDTHFQDAISRVKAPVHYLSTQGVRLPEFWTAIEEAAEILPDLWSQLKQAKGEVPVEIFQAITLAKLASEKELDGLHAHFATSSTAVARLAAHLAGIPFTFTAHAKDIFHESIELADLDKKFKDAQAIVTVSDFNLKYLNQILPQHKSKVVRIYNGLDLDRFQFEPESSKTNKIISVGRMVEKKGFIYLVQACEILSRTYPDFHCQIIGSGTEEERLRSEITRLGLEKKVELTGPLPQSEVIQELKAATVFAAPCIVGEDGNRDGLPTVLLEAMAVGTACVSTDVTGIPEILKHEETGLLAPQHNSAALASELEKLLRQDALRKKITVQARAMIESQFDIHTNTKLLRDVFFQRLNDKSQLLRKAS